MGLFQRKPKMIKSIYGVFPEFQSVESLPDDPTILRKMQMHYMSKYNYTDRDDHKAFLILQKLLELDTACLYMGARKNIGELYWDGRGVETDREKGLFYLNQYYQSLVLREQNYCAMGVGLNEYFQKNICDLNLLFSWIYERIKSDRISTVEPMGTILFRHIMQLVKDADLFRSDQDFFRNLFEENGSAAAAYHYGNFLLEEDYDKGKHLIRAAAESGDLFAISQMIEIYYNYPANDTEQNEKELFVNRLDDIIKKARETQKDFTDEIFLQNCADIGIIITD